MIISLDVETTGLDLAHSAKPFFVTTACDDGKHRNWEWLVNPITREPEIPEEDLEYIAELISAAELIYTHNGKFDVRALLKINIALPWEKVRDSLIASHILGTNHRHNLTDLCVNYLDKDIEHFEKNAREVVQACRKIAKRDHPEWKLADPGKEGMPSVKGNSKKDEDKPWKNDMWLPHRMFLDYDNADPKWETVCSKYANADSEYTLLLGLELERRLRQEKLWKIYLHRLELMRVDAEIEQYGITAIGDYTEATASKYEEHVAEAEAALVGIAAEYGHELQLADGASINDNMRDFFYGAKWVECRYCNYKRRIKHWNIGELEAKWLSETVDGEGRIQRFAICPKCASRRRSPTRRVLPVLSRDNLALVPIPHKDTDASLGKEAMEYYLATTEGDARDFIEILFDKRSYGTALSYMEQYRKFWIPEQGALGYYRIHCWINPCGTRHLRQSTNGPNMQNTSTKEIVGTRACFGPAPGREFWSLDYEQIESRIPAFESKEPKLIEIFEKHDQPPYWGKEYYLAASIFYPDEFWPRSKERDRFKDECPRLYKQAKFFVLAKKYGAGRRKGDLLSKVKNSYDLVDGELPKLAALQRYYLQQAEKLGYVETLPDVEVDPERGYPILAAETEDGGILTTTPFNYHVSGTACWIKNTALVACSNQCKQWRQEGFDAHISMEVHDEILFDFPRGPDKWANAWRALVLCKLMEQSGERVGIPSPVSVKRHEVCWALGESIPKEVLSASTITIEGSVAQA